MTNRTETPVDFDARLVDWLERTEPVAEPDDLLARVLATTSTTRRLPAWLGPARPLAWLEPSAERLGRTLLVAATLGLLILAFALTLAVGSRPQVPLPLGRPGTLIAARSGELQLVDPSGAVTARVATGEFGGYGAWSRDGSRIAYVTGSLDHPVLVVADGSLRTILTIDVPVGTSLPVTWAPDGRRIAFWVDNTEVTQVFVVDVAAGAVPVAITDRELRAERPSWSPDGDWIAFRGGIDLDQQALYIAHPDGGGVLRISQSGRAVDSACGFPWTPNARSIAFGTRFNGIWTVNVDGSNERQITASADQAYCPSISPKGDRLAAMTWLDTGKFIAVMALDGSRKVIPAGPLYDGWPAVWSPNGRSMAMNGRDLKGGPAPRAFLDPEGAAPARIVHLDGDAVFVDWQRLAP
jgi:Tol biopolymer transport system component